MCWIYYLKCTFTSYTFLSSCVFQKVSSMCEIKTICKIDCVKYLSTGLVIRSGQEVFLLSNQCWGEKRVQSCQSILNPFSFVFSLSTGCILGVGLVLSLMSHSSQTESRVHVSASLRKLCKYLDSSEDQSRWVQEV